ncbi:hypothetical protein GR212_22140 [Rhizobium lusitanum]|uniref:Uncharacterized protein n=2 Tax=Rhizobium lusitanum TaxID=293958 RepID=A0A6L9UA78_9HYPH|nr:hypothetical protein [Rhizobium lusitanum]NEI72289.1 hypothetical protein [Rhizobium lusitanum]
MPKQPKPFIVEIKTTRRKRTKAPEQPKSIWGNLTFELQQNLAEEREPSFGSPAPQPDAPVPDLPATSVIDEDEAETPPTAPLFFQKWSAKMAEKPQAKATDVVAIFLARIDRQKTLLDEFRSDPAAFRGWRSAWFRKVAGGFGVNIGRDSIDAGAGLRYVVVETVQAVAEFLDDLARHAQTDANFQCALEETRQRRAARVVRARPD